MVFSSYKKQRILYLSCQGFKAPAITKILMEEGMSASFCKGLRSQAVWGNLCLDVILNYMYESEKNCRKANETGWWDFSASTSRNLDLQGISVAIKKFRGSAYCQLIRDVNNEKRLTWAQENKDDNFDNAIFTDWVLCTNGNILAILL